MADEELMLMLDQLFQAITGTGTVIVSMLMLMLTLMLRLMLMLSGFPHEGSAG